MIGRLEGGDDLKVWVLAGKGNHALAHPSCGAMNCKANRHPALRSEC
jgi:hypothetical protein